MTRSTDTIPSPEALIRAALGAAADVAQNGDELTDLPDWLVNRIASIRALAKDPEAIARIIKAAEGRG